MLRSSRELEVDRVGKKPGPLLIFILQEEPPRKGIVRSERRPPTRKPQRPSL